MTLPPLFTYIDPRTGDTYNIDLDEDGDFLFATRFLDRVGGEKVTYSQLLEMPPAVRLSIEDKIARRKQK